MTKSGGQMSYYLFKIIISAALVVIVSEVAKRSALLGGALASLPFVSWLASRSI